MKNILKNPNWLEDCFDIHYGVTARQKTKLLIYIYKRLAMQPPKPLEFFFYR